MPSNQAVQTELSLPMSSVTTTEANARSAKELAVAEENAAAEAKAKSDAMQDDPEPTLIEALARGRDSLAQAMKRHSERVHAQSVMYQPPAPTERQRSNTELEMQAGRDALAKQAALQATVVPPKRDPNEGTTTKVKRPNDHVPKFGSRDPGK